MIKEKTLMNLNLFFASFLSLIINKCIIEFQLLEGYLKTQHFVHGQRCENWVRISSQKLMLIHILFPFFTRSILKKVNKMKKSPETRSLKNAYRRFVVWGQNYFTLWFPTAVQLTTRKVFKIRFCFFSNIYETTKKMYQFDKKWNGMEREWSQSYSIRFSLA